MCDNQREAAVQLSVQGHQQRRLGPLAVGTPQTTYRPTQRQVHRCENLIFRMPEFYVT